MINNTLLTEKESSYETTIYVSEEVFNKLIMSIDCHEFVSFDEERIISLRGMTFAENKSLPENTILTPNSKEVARLQKERYENMLDDLEKFGGLYGGRYE